MHMNYIRYQKLDDTTAISYVSKHDLLNVEASNHFKGCNQHVFQTK